ncbi:hypothetical protein IOC61_06915 [Halomonas sp. KAO]|uniref:hypothetical protein n=1 Tax=unclassified Halomonas TaxID=2609666 RepID=UPI0018A03232|nr:MULTISPECIES: hypothetical protein [unclassified Halomonas]MBF7053052.1 hypothetical protein [Halomonas sp. KAO]MDT0500648.1 hypothetical protein [Halomonas sp. PAR7]MDT0513161.1 hypothetical protein [Halomonas sp. LES1]MDT0591428.1 hypothetical protein [Halomonas sp. PAR8]
MSQRAIRWSRRGGQLACLAPWLLACLPLMALANAPAPSPSPQHSAPLQAASAHSIAPRPFSARYRLEVEGWPAAYVDHRLSREGDYWESLMETNIQVARGSERGRFMLQDEGVQSLYYASGYALLGVGDSYQLDAEPLEALPDRQTALFAFSRRIISGDCADSPCDIRYLDHKGREERLRVHTQGRSRITLPAGSFEAITAEAWEVDEPDRRLLFRFHPEVPGLLLSVDYHRDGKRRSQLRLSRLTLPD